MTQDSRVDGGDDEHTGYVYTSWHGNGNALGYGEERKLGLLLLNGWLDGGRRAERGGGKREEDVRF